MEEKTFTVFVDASDGWHGYSYRDEVTTLAQAIEVAAQPSRSSWKATFTPIAWMEGRCRHWEKDRDESVSAGRTIERVGDRYVARGVEEKPESYGVDLIRQWAETERARIEAFQRNAKPDPAAANHALPAEPKRPALTWNTKTEFDAFPGFVVKSCTEEQPKQASYMGIFRSPDLA